MKPGDHVHVALLGKGVLREARNGRRWLVEIKGRSMLVEEAQLSPVESRKSRARIDVPPEPAVPESLARAHAAASIDLHGMTTEEAITALDGFLNDAILGGLAEVQVIHGRSGGRVKAAVHGRLRGMSSIRAFRVDPRNPGVTIVTF